MIPIERRYALFVLSCLAAALPNARGAQPAGGGNRVPGVVVAHSPAASRQYIGSPSIVVLPDGALVATHDLFGPGSTKNITRVYASTDRGANWTRHAEIQGQWWSTLFLHDGALYLIGPDREYGRVVIRRSTDRGKTWTEPKDGKSGLLLADGPYHCAPVPVIVYAGRLWRAMEDAQGPGGWGSHFRAFMMSAPVGADLLDAASWTCSNRLGRDPAWLDGKFGGWLEGNAVVTPEGKVFDILRVDRPPGPEVAAVVSISTDGTTARFDPATGFVDFPGGSKKFSIRFDPATHHYWSLANIVPESDRQRKPASVRNHLALIASPDLKQWRVLKVVLSHPDIVRHGFQYADWQWDGDDLIALVRTAFDDDQGGAHNAHDANFLTFHRIAAARRLLDAPAGAALERPRKVLLLGDSTTIGSICRRVVPQGPHLEDVIRGLLAAEKDLPPTEVINQGRDGEYIQRLFTSGRYDRDIAPLRNVDYVLIRYGLNDINRRDDFATNFPKDFAELLARLRKDFPKAVLVPMTVIPVNSPEREERINKMVRQVAETEKLPLLDIYDRYRAELAHGQNMLNYRRYPLAKVTEKYREWVAPFVRGKDVVVMDNVLDVHFRDLPGWFSDRHPNLAGYHVIGAETARFLAEQLREQVRASSSGGKPASIQDGQ